MSTSLKLDWLEAAVDRPLSESQRRPGHPNQWVAAPALMKSPTNQVFLNCFTIFSGILLAVSQDFPSFFAGARAWAGACEEGWKMCVFFKRVSSASVQSNLEKMNEKCRNNCLFWPFLQALQRPPSLHNRRPCTPLKYESCWVPS